MLKIAKNLSLPLDFVTERIAFLARTGAGKSGGMRVLFEQALDNSQFVIFIDPKGDAWGIRAAGKGPGRPVLVMGGDHGDVPLEPTAGKFIAEFLVRERVSTVIDISDFKTADMNRFVADFASTLYRRNRDVVLVMIDEADMVAGEKYFNPDTLHGIQLIQNKGRHRGFGLVVATQRSAILNKTVLYASGTLIAMQTTGSGDIDAIRGWLKYAGTKEATEEILSALPTLKSREAFVYSPQTLGSSPVRITFDSFNTFDSMRTPKPGETRQTPKRIADIDLSAVQRDMAATIEKVKSEDPKLLQAENAKLKADLRKLESRPAKTETQTKEVEIPVFPVGAKIELDKISSRVSQRISAIERLRGELEADHNEIRSILDKYSQNTPSPRPAITHEARPAVQQINVPAKAATTTQPPAEGVSGAQQRVLDALALCESLGIERPERINVAFFAGYTVNGHFNNLVGNLRTAGLIDYPEGGKLSLTESGRAIANADSNPISSLEDFHNLWKSKLSAPEQRIVSILLENYPNAVSRDDLAGAAGYTVNGHFNNLVGHLRTLGIADYPFGGHVAATNVMFPPGLN